MYGRTYKVAPEPYGGTYAAFALIVGIATANSACEIIWHQPKEPSAMDKFKF